MELTTIEQSELEQLESVIKQNVNAFYKVGCALAKIRDSRLYRETHETFESYCKSRWDMGRNYTNKIIASATVIESLGTTVPIVPTNERQVRPLTKLTPEQQQEAWQEVVETAPEGKITAKHVSNVVCKLRKEDIADKVDKQVQAVRRMKRDEIIDEEMQKAFDIFFHEVQRAKMEKWKNTSKEAALKLTKLIKALIEIT